MLSYGEPVALPQSCGLLLGLGVQVHVAQNACWLLDLWTLFLAGDPDLFCLKVVFPAV